MNILASTLALLTDPVMGSILALFLLFALLDLVLPARRQTASPWWKLRGIAGAVTYFGIGLTAPALWNGWLGAHRLVDLTGLPAWAQLAIGLFVLEALIFAWHRTMHAVDPIWRHVHQTHHSAERVDIWGAFYFHPLDSLGWAFLGSLALVGGVGLDVGPAVAVNVVSAFCSMFQHANIRTPQWLGYIVTRPESHSVHHARGVHGLNYGDVPWFDMLFGTFRNPKDFAEAAGFYDGASLKLWPLLIGKKLA